MSADTRLDQRLREAFGADDDWIPDLSLAEVRAEARRTTARRRAALATAAAVVLAAGVAVAVGVDDRPGRADPAVPTVPTSPSSSPSAAEGVGSAVEGDWLTPPFSSDQLRRRLVRAGWGGEADAVLADLQLDSFNRFRLRIEGGYVDTWVMHSNMEDDERVDRQTYVVDGDRLVMVPRETGGSTVFTWVRDRDRLNLELVSTTEPDVQGIPAEAVLRALYSSTWFTPLA